MDIKHFVVEVMKELVPHATITDGGCQSDICLDVSWKLNSDPDRANKMSKTIKICISQEVVEDLKEISQNEWQIACNRIKNYLTQEFQRFDPEHNSPKSNLNPEEKWLITTDFIKF